MGGVGYLIRLTCTLGGWVGVAGSTGEYGRGGRIGGAVD